MNAQRQTNTFQKGMNTDLDYSVIDSGQYQWAENIRIIANDDCSTGVMQNIEGVRKLNPTLTLSGETIIHTNTIRDWAIVFTKKGNNFNIYRYDFGASETDPVVTTVASNLPLEIPMVDGHYAISSVCKWESDEYVKIYWCDGIHQIRLLNVAKTYSSLDVNSLNVVPESTLPPLKFNGLGTGSLKAGMYQYCYQLFNTRSNETSLSVLSTMIRANKDDDKSNSKDITGSSTEENTSKSIKLKVVFDSNDFTMARIIRLYYKNNTDEPIIDIIEETSFSGSVLEYEDKGGNFISELTTEELNSIVSYDFSPKVLEAKDNILFAANVKENTWDISEEDYDARAYRCNTTGSVLLLSNTGTSLTPFSITDETSLAAVPLNHDCICPYNTSTGSGADSEYKYAPTNTGNYVQGGKGLNISYEFVVTDLIEDDSTTTDGLLPDDWKLGAKAIPLSSLQVYSSRQGNKTELGSITLTSGYKIPNYADSEIDANVKGYQRDEVYRFGIVFYNKNNVPSSVHWIADIRMPKATDTGYNLFNAGADAKVNNQVYSSKTLVTHPLGIVFTVNIPQTLIDKGVTGYEIVRCERTINDRSILMQGVISNVTQNPTTATMLTPFPYLAYSDSNALTSMSESYRYTWDFGKVKSQDYIRFISPDICVNRENNQEILSKATEIESIYSLRSSVRPSTSMGDGTFFNKTSWNGSIKVKPLAAAGNVTYWDKEGAIVGNYPTNDADYAGNDGWLYDSVHVNSNDDGDEGNVSHALRIDGNIGYGSLLNYHASYNAVLAKYYLATALNNKVATIDDIAYATNTDSRDLDEFRWYTKPTAISDKLYYNWLWDDRTNPTNDTSSGHNNNMRKMGPGGICAIIHSKDIDINIPRTDVVSSTNLVDAVSVKLCNLKQAVNPYGGNTYSARQNSTYISNGSYNTVNGVNTQSTICYGGDTYIGVLDYAAGMMGFSNSGFGFNSDNQVNSFNRVYSGAYIPCESTINLSLRNDDVQVSKTYNEEGWANHFVQNDITAIGTLYSQNEPLYAYNSAYSAQPRSKNYVSKSMYSIDDLHTDTRVIHSDPARNLEVSDSWTKFKVANYLDVDTRFGSINNMKLFKNHLLFWQTDAFGTLSVNERSLIQDNNTSSLTLGTGGTLTRFDYFTTKNGSKENQLRTATQSDSTVYWYDADRNEICGFDNQLHTVSKLKGVQSYLHDNKEIIINDPISVYDKKYNEVLLTLENKTLVFNEQVGAFTSFYTYKPDWYAEFTDKLIIYKNLAVYKYNSGNELDMFTGKDKISYIRFIVNDKYPQTKTFDNVEYGGDFTYDTNFNNIYFETKRQTSFTLTEDDIDYREDTYKFCIPRSDRELNEAEELVNKSYRDRMKGKYLICHYKYDCNGGNTFKVPYISTAYRYSLI